MTKLLDDALAVVRGLPPDEQDSIARAVMRLAGQDDEPPVALSAEERAAVAASKAAAARRIRKRRAGARGLGQTRLVRLRYTLPALADLDAVLDRLAAQSPQGARRVQRRIQAMTELLPLHPGIGRRTDDPATRRMVASPSPVPDLLRSHGRRDHHPRRSPRGTRSVRQARRAGLGRIIHRGTEQDRRIHA